MKDCQECANLRERSAELYAAFVTARDALAMTRKHDSDFVTKRKEVEQLRGQLRQAHQNENNHQSEIHGPANSN
jgi:hypothetical protein